MTIGLRKKHEENDLDYYESLYKSMPTDKHAAFKDVGDHFF